MSFPFHENVSNSASIPSTWAPGMIGQFFSCFVIWSGSVAGGVSRCDGQIALLHDPVLLIIVTVCVDGILFDKLDCYYFLDHVCWCFCYPIELVLVVSKDSWY